MKQGERVLLDDEGNMTAKDGDLVHCIKCIKCNEYVYAKEIFKNQNVVCPHCGGKIKIRFYKNGNVRVSIR